MTTGLSRSLLLSSIVIAALPATCLAGELIVPAYFYPGTGGPGGVGNGWAAMTAAAAEIPITAILNPNSGPLPGPADPNYTAAMTNLEAARGSAVAYVFTNYGSTPLATVESEITTYISQYGSLIDGFYLDGMLITPSTLAYYRSLDTFIHGLSSPYKVIGNPGQPFLNGVAPSEYLSTANIFDIFEGPNTAPSPGAAGFNSYPYGLNWFQSFSSSRFDNTIYYTPGFSLLADLERAAALNSGSVYVTDQNTPNPYSQLPSYWNQEVADIKSLNATVPEPSSVCLLVLAGLITALTVVVKQRRNKGVTQLPSQAAVRLLIRRSCR